MTATAAGPQAGRLERVRRAMAESEVGALVVTNNTNVQWISGFTGSSGFVLLTPDLARFATDSRYTEQAAAQPTGGGTTR